METPLLAFTHSEALILYTQIYNHLVQEKHKAGKKKIVVLGAESHSDKRNLFVAFATADITRRLGFKSGLIETQSSIFTGVRKNLNETIRINGFLNGQMLKIPSSEQVFLKQLSLFSLFRKFFVGKQNGPFFVTFGLQCGFNYYPVDPKYSERLQLVDELEKREKRGEIVDYSVLISERFEKPMVQAITMIAKQSDCFGIFGALHVPYLAEKLQKKGFHTIMISCDHDPTSDSDRQVFLERMVALKTAFTPPNSDYPTNESASLKLALKASISHRQKVGELNETNAEKYLAFIDTIAAGQTFVSGVQHLERHEP